MWLGKGGWLRVRELDRQVEAQKKTNEALAARNAALDADVRDLKQGFDAIEERARSELGMIRGDEVFFQLPMNARLAGSLETGASEIERARGARFRRSASAVHYQPAVNAHRAPRHFPRQSAPEAGAAVDVVIARAAQGRTVRARRREPGRCLSRAPRRPRDRGRARRPRCRRAAATPARASAAGTGSHPRRGRLDSADSIAPGNRRRRGRAHPRAGARARRRFLHAPRRRSGSRQRGVDSAQRCRGGRGAGIHVGRVRVRVVAQGLARGAGRPLPSRHLRECRPRCMDADISTARPSPR